MIATYFVNSIEKITDVHIMFPVHANEVFVKLKPEVEVGLRQRGWVFHALYRRIKPICVYLGFG